MSWVSACPKYTVPGAGDENNESWPPLGKETKWNVNAPKIWSDGVNCYHRENAKHGAWKRGHWAEYNRWVCSGR